MAFRWIKGPEQMQAKMLRIAGDFPDLAEDATVYEFEEIELPEIRRRTPILTGALRMSEHVERRPRKAKRIEVAIVAGGSMAPYAVVVHEDTDAFHRIGQAKYMEEPLNESAPYMAARISRRINQALGRRF